MIGVDIEAKRRLGAGFWICAGLAGLCLVLGVLGSEPNWFAIAALPVILMVLRVLRSAPSVHCRFGEAGIEFVDRMDPMIEYEAIVHVEAACGSGKGTPLGISHTRGHLVLPRTTNPSPGEIEAYLRSRIPSKPDDLASSLRDFRDAEKGVFGGERVFVYRGKPPLAKGLRRSADRSIGAAFMLFSIVCFVMAALRESDGWIASGVMFLLFGFLIFLLGKASTGAGQNLRKRWRDNGLVISPSGLALAQGDLRGVLKWDEVQSVRLRSRRSFRLSNSTTPTGVLVGVEGSLIAIADVFDERPTAIAATIRRYWRG